MIDEKGVRLLYDERSTRPEELSTMITCFNEGTRADATVGLARSSMRCFSSGVLSRGSFRGKLDSALMIR